MKKYKKGKIRMKNFVIVSDSCCDLEKALREKYDVEYIPMHLAYEGKTADADLDWKEISVKEFYRMMREGTRFITSQINDAEYREQFEKYLQAGYDILSISCSSGLSNSVIASYRVRDELMGKYPDRKIVCIDSLNSGYALGFLCVRASELRAEGKTIEEAAAWVEANRKKVNQEFTVDKLTYLKQAGRVSATSAFFGGLLSVKPIIVSDVKGHNAAEEKVKGRRASLLRIAERFREKYEEVPFQKLFISHADCEEDAEELKQEIIKIVPHKADDIHLGYIGPIIGASAGPGTVGVYFYGKEVTFDGSTK